MRLYKYVFSSKDQRVSSVEYSAKGKTKDFTKLFENQEFNEFKLDRCSTCYGCQYVKIDAQNYLLKFECANYNSRSNQKFTERMILSLTNDGFIVVTDSNCDLLNCKDSYLDCWFTFKSVVLGLLSLEYVKTRENKDFLKVIFGNICTKCWIRDLQDLRWFFGALNGKEFANFSKSVTDKIDDYYHDIYDFVSDSKITEEKRKNELWHFLNNKDNAFRMMNYSRYHLYYIDEHLEVLDDDKFYRKQLQTYINDFYHFDTE